MMKEILYVLLFILLLIVVCFTFSCTTRIPEKQLFQNKFVDSLVRNSISQLRNIDKDSLYDEFYIFQRNDTLLVVNVNFSNTPLILLFSNENTCSDYNNYKIKVRNTSSVENFIPMNLLHKKECEERSIPFGQGSGTDTINGIIYKISKVDSNIHLTEIMSGNLYQFFLKNKSFHIKKVPIEEPKREIKTPYDSIQ